MSLQEIKDSAFGSWIRAQDRDYAAYHLFQCLANGGPNNIAWYLLEALEIKRITRESLYEMVDALTLK